VSAANPIGDLEPVLARFPRERRWLLPALQAVQGRLGHLPLDALSRVGAHLRVPASEVYGVATHYPELRLAPVGAHHVRVCRGVSCDLLGSGDLLAALARRLDTLPDLAAVTLETADCLFACAVAPVIEVDGAYRGRVRAADAAGIARSLARSSPSHGGESAGPQPGRGSDQPERPSLAALVERASSRRSAGPALHLLLQAGTCGRAVGADEVLAALRETVDRSGIAARIVEGACSGTCYAAPALEIRREGWPRAVVERLDPARVPALVEALDEGGGDLGRAGLTGVAWCAEAWRGLTPALQHPFWSAQTRVLLDRCGRIDPGDLDDALVHGAYQALARALAGSPGDVIAAVKASGLQGRGGAFFPTALKWEACRGAAGTPRYLVMNGEEGEPGIFKDRHLMEGDPHQVLEGVLLGAFAAGATQALLYVHGEAHLSARRLALAVAQATAAGLAGDRILGSDFSCGVEIRRGAGGFVLGEETALLESIEGRRALPRTRPPFPVESGLWGRPTVINNVETLAAIPSIVTRGGPWFAAHGIPEAPGTKVFGLSGALRRPGVVEVGNGVTLRMLLEGIGGGAPEGRALQGALVGGPSGTIVPADRFDVAMEPRGRVSPGTGGIVAVPAGASVVEIVRTLLRFNADESCGKCTPCREGVPRLLAMLDELAAGGGAGPVVARARELASTIHLASLCGLGQAAPQALLRALEDFPGAFGAPLDPNGQE
jgi:NADH:ubiquinone oxidoreductase subunit F (NADH-binding)/NADH:ubiquinone oxidoreductase subunit E